MAKLARRLADNVEGEFFVDESCIDCDTCRWMAPATFTRRAEQSSVHAQPTNEVDLRRAEMALLACPTGSIGTTRKRDLQAARAAFPDPLAPGLYHTGYHAESSFGATSYLLVRDAGNVLVDSPRFNRDLARRIGELGGVATLFLTHRDDVADHARWAAHFGCERVLHAADRRPGTAAVERWIEGTEPVALDDQLTVIPVPGHTAGSACLLFEDQFLFTGDHLAWSERLGHVYAFRSACWYDWNELVASTERLRARAFEWILPGHGRRCRFPRAEMAGQMDRALEWMRSLA